MYEQITNPSKTHIMKATLKNNVPLWGSDEDKVFFLKPGYVMPIHGPVQWSRWEFSWEPLPRKGLVRFSR